ncbi:putative oxidoreductase [Paraphysoderma sedebokerense]|nr:putative oxidoreductase [Paraphysoderma sedebokerense]
MPNSKPDLPTSFRKIVVKKLSNDFDEATEIRTADMSTTIQSLKPNEILIQNHYLGINASDINFTAGRYDPTMRPPFDAGFEAVGEVVAVGDGVKKVKLGSKVAFMKYGAFTEFMTIDERLVFPVPDIRPEYLNLVNGLTAYLALHAAANIKAGETVLVTAASGGTGQIACQVAKQAGCKVIGTCGSQDKVEYLKSIGVDRPINYKTENLDKVLKTEFPEGIDVCFDGVGGEMLNTIIKRLAVRSRLLIIGSVSAYQNTNQNSKLLFDDTVPTYLLLSKSISVIGFFLNHYMKDGGMKAWAHLVDGISKGTISFSVDMQDFRGLEDVSRGIKHLFAGKNIGKVVIRVGEAKAKM